MPLLVHELETNAAPDHLRGVIGRTPANGLAELIWNALDAEAELVEVEVRKTESGSVSQVVVSDDGHGFTQAEVDGLFSSLGGSWKRSKANRKTRNGKRDLHGQRGQGRWKALSIGDRVTWESVTEEADGNFLTTLEMTAASPNKTRWSDPVQTSRKSGTIVTIDVGGQEPDSLLRESIVHRLTSYFALYLARYPTVQISFNGDILDPHKLRRDTFTTPLSSGAEHGPAELTILEWSIQVEREICLCDSSKSSLYQLPAGIHAKDFNFTAYIVWDGFRVHESVLPLAEMASPEVSHVIAEARTVMRDHFRDKRKLGRISIIDSWRKEDVYPFSEEEGEPAEEAAKAVFNFVATTASDAVNSIKDQTAKRLSLSAIRVALESDPGSLEKVIQEVLALPAERLEELRELIDKTSLTAILSTSRMVSSRLELIMGLEALLFDPEIRSSVLERAHLHKILESAPWLYGERFATHVSDQSLTALLKAHLGLIGRDDLVGSVDSVVDVDGGDRRVDGEFNRSLLQ